MRSSTSAGLRSYPNSPIKAETEAASALSTSRIRMDVILADEGELWHRELATVIKTDSIYANLLSESISNLVWNSNIRPLWFQIFGVSGNDQATFRTGRCIDNRIWNLEP